MFGEDDGFYPGQTLRGRASVFKSARWLSGQQPILSSKAHMRATVEEVCMYMGVCVFALVCIAQEVCMYMFVCVCTYMHVLPKSLKKSFNTGIK